MTTYASSTVRCANCGTTVELTVLTSTNAMGSPDLDLRPPQMERSTMETWLQECPQCGYVGQDISQLARNMDSILASKEYQEADQAGLKPLAVRFVRYAMIAGDTELSGISLLRAAWVCDDAKNETAALRLRNEAANTLLSLQPFEELPRGATVGTIAVDILRRSGRFEVAEILIERLLKMPETQQNEIICNVLKFQQKLCQQSDTACHRLKETAV